MNVAIVVFEGFEELDAVGPYEVFQLAGAETGTVEANLVTLDGSDPVEARHGLRIEPDAELSAVDPDLLVVPGGGWNDGGGVRRACERGALPAAIAECHDAGVRVASVCTGAFLLSEAGLLDGRPATTHRSALDDLRETGADVRTSRTTDDGDVLTAGGITSGFDLALHVVESEMGPEVADAVAAELEYERVL